MAERIVKLGATPTLLKLKAMRGEDGKPLKIIQTIAAGDYMTFGMYLLQDDNGVEVELIEKNNKDKGADGVTQSILQKWLTSGAAPTRTYQHLIECLEQSELGALADLMLIANTTPADNACLPIISPQEKYQTTTQGSDCLTSYASSLKELYTSMARSHTSQHWSHLPRCEFIQLAMIKDDQVRRGGPEEERVRLAQQGKIEVIMCQKEEIDLTNIFLPPKSQPPPPPPPSPSLKLPISHQAPKPILSISILPPLKHRVILIEGAPGGGKSTLAVHICHMWAQGAFFLANFNMVILAYLRDEAIQNASTLANILPADVTKVSQSSSDIATEIKASYGFKVLFIFDGWDEFPPELQNNSLISTIIREPHKLCLQQSTVIVTTRPVASGNLLHIADQRVEILGFTPQQIREYIEKALNGDSTRIQKLVQHLEEHPVIEGYCYIPLHVAILVHIFLTRKEALPTTRHELFRDLVLCCIVRELETHKSDQNVKTEISSFKDLPHVIKSQLNDLCLLAYNGVTQNEVVFYRKHLQVLHLPSNLPSLGLLQAVEGLTRFSKSLLYNFLHLSVQELLAAYNISQLKSSKQVKVFKSLFGSFRFQPVLHSFCGFTKLENPAIQDYISANLSKSSSFKELLPFLHCFFEAQQPTLCQLVSHKFRKLVVNSKSCRSFSCWLLHNLTHVHIICY